MGLSFRKSIKISDVIRLNLSKSGVGVSFGKKGLRYSISPKGRHTLTVGIPGTGIYYRKHISIPKNKIKDTAIDSDKDME